MHSFTYNDIDYSGIVYVENAKHAVMPKPRVTVDRYASTDGAAIQGRTYDMMEINLECSLVGTDTDDRQVKMSAVIAGLSVSQAQGGKDLVIDLLPGKVWTSARLVSGIDSNISARMERFSLKFLADPWPAAAEESDTGDMATSGTGTTVYSL